MNLVQQRSLLTRVRDGCRRFLSGVTCRGRHGDVVHPPRPSYPRASTPAPTQQAGASSQQPIRPAAAGTSYVVPPPPLPPSWHATTGPSTVPQMQYTWSSYPSSAAPELRPTGYVDQGWHSEESHDKAARASSSAWIDDLFRVDADLLGPSQLPDAPGPT
ncbi:uncharacterized protein LOC111256593 [Setaria italica]|uniref:uncharacterized protein LOC111256593 n=1 Tax=Setaria italica TaxID=4555 RepID=UPI000BE5F468|nr:uncharacterized protein LOC111256593 [Setaria italica]